MAQCYSIIKWFVKWNSWYVYVCERESWVQNCHETLIHRLAPASFVYSITSHTSPLLLAVWNHFPKKKSPTTSFECISMLLNNSCLPPVCVTMWVLFLALLVRGNNSVDKKYKSCKGIENIKEPISQDKTRS